MKFKEFMDMYDNWNGITVVNNNNLEKIVEGETLSVIDNHTELYDREVIAFGFYDDVFYVRIT